MKFFKKKNKEFTAGLLRRPIGSKVGVIRLETKTNKDELAVGTIVGSRFDWRRNMNLYAVKFEDGKINVLQENELWNYGQAEIQSKEA